MIDKIVNNLSALAQTGKINEIIDGLNNIPTLPNYLGIDGVAVTNQNFTQLNITKSSSAFDCTSSYDGTHRPKPTQTVVYERVQNTMPATGTIRATDSTYKIVNGKLFYYTTQIGTYTDWTDCNNIFAIRAGSLYKLSANANPILLSSSYSFAKVACSGRYVSNPSCDYFNYFISTSGQLIYMKIAKDSGTITYGQVGSATNWQYVGGHSETVEDNDYIFCYAIAGNSDWAENGTGQLYRLYQTGASAVGSAQCWTCPLGSRLYNSSSSSNYKYSFLIYGSSKLLYYVANTTLTAANLEGGWTALSPEAQWEKTHDATDKELPYFTWASGYGIRGGQLVKFNVTVRGWNHTSYGTLYVTVINATRNWLALLTGTTGVTTDGLTTISAEAPIIAPGIPNYYIGGSLAWYPDCIYYGSSLIAADWVLAGTTTKASLAQHYATVTGTPSVGDTITFSYTNTNAVTISSSAPYIYDTYVNGNSGYILWSNRFILQWGQITNTTSVKAHNSITVTIPFVKSMANTDYIVTATPGGTAFTTAMADSGYTTAAFVMSFGNKNTDNSARLNIVAWMAVGYAATLS